MQMEVESLIAHGAENSLKELLTVKSDQKDEKSELLRQIIETGSYEMTDVTNQKSGTKTVVNTLLEFLKK